MTQSENISKIEGRAQQFAAALKDEGLDLLQVLCLVTYETPEGPGMAVVSTEEAPQSLKSRMLMKALEGK